MISLRNVAIQGAPGSNSHLAAHSMLGPAVPILPCGFSAEVVAAVLSGAADGAVLPIENSLHGSVAEHYDLLLEHPLRIDAEELLRIEHHVIAAPGVALGDVRVLLSHPVALSQCRRFLSAFSQGKAAPFFDTAGAVRHVVEAQLPDAAALAPRLAADLYGGAVLLANVEDHAENYTRFHLLRRADAPRPTAACPDDKMSLAFSVEHRPGALVQALAALALAGANLTKIESRPVPGKPWEYVFFVDLRYTNDAMAEAVLQALRTHCSMLKELGRYPAA